MRFSEKILSYFPTPHFLDMPHVGVDITPTSIKYAEFIKTPGRLKLGRYGTQPLAVPVSFDEPLSLNKDLEIALKRIQRAHKITFVEVSIPEVKSYLFTMEVPAGSEASIRTNVELHLEENVPLTLTEAIFEYFPIHLNEKTNMLTVSVSVVPYKTVQEYLQLFENCGMTPVSFLIENQAMVKAVIDTNDTGTYLIVQISERRTVLSVVSDHAVQFTASVLVGSADFTNDVAKAFKKEQAEAEKMKLAQDGNEGKFEDSEVFMSMVNSFSALKDEIERVYVYWQSYQEKSPAAPSLTPIKKIILSGRDATISGLQEYLSTSLHAPIGIANVWKNAFSFDDAIPPIEQAESLDYGTAIGLALPKNKY